MSDKIYGAMRTFGIIISSLLGALTFTVVGTYLPQLYTRYFDSTDYFEIESITIADKIFQPCEELEVNVYRKIPVDIQASYIDELILIHLEDEKIVEKESVRYTGDAFWQVGEKEVQLSYTLPCEIENGEYYIKSSSSFTVNNISKLESFETPVFTVQSNN